MTTLIKILLLGFLVYYTLVSHHDFYHDEKIDGIYEAVLGCACLFGLIFVTIL